MPCDDTDKGQWVAETASRPLIENRRPASQQGRLPQSRQSPYDCWSWAAHPADSFDQVGGTLAHHAAEGDHVSALILSGGVRSHDWQLVDYHLKSDDGFDVEKETTEATTPKEDEVRRACGLRGIHDLHFLGLEDDADRRAIEDTFKNTKQFMGANNPRRSKAKAPNERQA